MAKDTNFKLGQSGNPKATFKSGNPYRWPAGHSGNPAGKSRSRLKFEEAFYTALLEQGAPEEAASLLWECARAKEPWALQALLQRLAPDIQQIKLTHGVEDVPAIDFTRLNDSELEQLERLLQRAATSSAEVEGGESKAQPEGIRDTGLANPGAGH
jgi:hypothetical protein